MYIDKFTVFFVLVMVKKAGAWKQKSKHYKKNVEKPVRSTSINLLTEKKKGESFNPNYKQKLWILITCARLHLLKLSPKSVYTLTRLWHAYVIMSIAASMMS
jgi:hypothetical protein